MEIKLYSIKDTVAGVFGSPFLASSVGLAVRQFRYMMKNAPMVANDCALSVPFYECIFILYF